MNIVSNSGQTQAIAHHEPTHFARDPSSFCGGDFGYLGLINNSGAFDLEREKVALLVNGNLNTGDAQGVGNGSSICYKCGFILVNTPPLWWISKGRRHPIDQLHLTGPSWLLVHNRFGFHWSYGFWSRWAIAQTRVRSFCIVVPPPLLDQDLRLSPAKEDRTAEQLIPHPLFEAFAICVFPR